MTLRIALLVCVLICASCKKDENKIIGDEINKDIVENFQFTTDIIIKDTTDLILYYKDGGNEWMVDEKTIWNTVPGRDEVQRIVFNFEEGIVPNDFRLDIGRNEYKNQQPIEIKKITMSYFDKTFDVSQEQINYFFKPNQNLIYNEETKQYALQKDVNGNYDPFFETAPTIYPQITNLVMGN